MVTKEKFLELINKALNANYQKISQIPTENLMKFKTILEIVVLMNENSVYFFKRSLDEDVIDSGRK